MPRLFHLVALVALLPLLVAPAPSFAEEDDPLVIEVIDVGALVGGIPNYIGRFVGLPDPDNHGGEDLPLFGSEAEEPLFATGSLSSLVSYLTETVLDPAQVEDGRADVMELQGNKLLVKLPRSALPRLMAEVQELEALARTTVTIDMALIPELFLPAAARKGASVLPADWVLTSGAPSLRLVAAPGQRVTGWVGKQHAYLYDFDVEVAEGSDVPDPLVNVMNMGFGVDAIVQMRLGAKTVFLHSQGAHAHLSSIERKTTDAELVIEMPVVDRAAVDFSTFLDVGEWTILDRLTHGKFNAAVVARVTVDTAEAGTGETPKGLGLVPTTDVSSAVERRLYDVQDLLVWAVSTREVGPGFLTPSNFTPPEPPELAEPYAIFPDDGLADLLGATLGEGAMARKGVSIEPGVLERFLSVRGTPGMHAQVERALKHFRERLVWRVETQVEVLEVEKNLISEIQSDGTAIVSEALHATLHELRESRRAKQLGTLSVPSLQGVPRGASVGKTHAYLGDFEVEIAKDAWIANPVMAEIREGTRVNIEAQLAANRGGVRLIWQVLQSELALPIREAATPHGSVQTPMLGVTRARGSAYVPMGQTVIAGVCHDDDRASLILLTPRLVAPSAD